MRIHRARLTGIAVCAAALAVAAPASGETVTYTAPGLTTVTLPAGVLRVHAVAVGARGGGLQGGFGAVVTADFDLATSSGLSNQIRVFVGGNGAVGVAGANGGGETPLPSLAGGGGGWSGVSPCIIVAAGGRCSTFLRAMVAGGGGGAGADGLPGTGGAGGSAGATGGSGSATALLAAAGGGEVGDGGSGGVSSDADCGDGDPGEPPTTGLDTAGGAGGTSGSLDGHGDGGGGGGGRPTGSGGGGGAGAWCIDNTGASGGGGGGGASLVPAGGQLGADATGVPSVTLTYEQEHPGVTIATPADGAVYAQGSVVAAAYACTATSALTPIASCSGPIAAGAAIDTSTLGFHRFAVNATDALGMGGHAAVRYSVTDQTAPAFRRLRIVPDAIDATRRGAFAMVRFRLSEAAQVQVSIQPARHRGARTSRTRQTTIACRANANSFRLRARIGRRTLRAGSYRLTLVAIDRAGNHSRPAQRRFAVTD